MLIILLRLTEYAYKIDMKFFIFHSSEVNYEIIYALSHNYSYKNTTANMAVDLAVIMEVFEFNKLSHAQTVV